MWIITSCTYPDLSDLSNIPLSHTVFSNILMFHLAKNTHMTNSEYFGTSVVRKIRQVSVRFAATACHAMPRPAKSMGWSDPTSESKRRVVTSSAMSSALLHMQWEDAGNRFADVSMRFSWWKTGLGPWSIVLVSVQGLSAAKTNRCGLWSSRCKAHTSPQS